jgi:hypothetical protein
MDKETALSIQTLELTEGPFGNLLYSPYEVDFGADPISVKDLQVRLGDRPFAKNLRRLYELGHKELPPDLAVFDVYDIWIITHVIGAVRQKGRASIQTLGYEADFEDEDQVYTVDILPRPKFNTMMGVSFENQVDLGIEGHGQLPEEARAFLDAVEFLGGDAKLTLSSDVKVVGRVSFSLMSPIIQAVGIGASRCEWCFEVDRAPLLGDQIMLQTILVPKRTKIVKLKVRGYALIKTGWISFPAMFRTSWLEVECQLH